VLWEGEYVRCCAILAGLRNTGTIAVPIWRSRAVLTRKPSCSPEPDREPGSERAEQEMDDPGSEPDPIPFRDWPAPTITRMPGDTSAHLGLLDPYLRMTNVHTLQQSFLYPVGRKNTL
jgi:hypothetical protein